VAASTTHRLGYDSRYRTYYDITVLLFFCKHGDVIKVEPFAPTTSFPSYADTILAYQYVHLCHTHSGADRLREIDAFSVERSPRDHFSAF
jgi:hypothetical protein